MSPTTSSFWARQAEREAAAKAAAREAAEREMDERNGGVCDRCLTWQPNVLFGSCLPCFNDWRGPEEAEKGDATSR